jgi:hypothetical protein
MNIIFIAALVILLAVWLEELNYRKVHKIVRERWANGDRTCGARKVWWGWRVIEYAEEEGSAL